jgi:aminoglycoside 3-N-acetyltransferase
LAASESLSPKFGKFVKRFKHAIKPRIVQTVWGYDGNDLLKSLRHLGLRQGDLIMVHCGFTPLSGFSGTPQDLIETFLSAVGAGGTVAMMSMPYHGISSYQYLCQGKPFDVRRSISMVGIVTEVFRRRPDVIRGIHPTHPVAAMGAQAEWLVSGQGREVSPFGNQSPFARLVELNGKVLLYDVPFNTMTFEHYLEHSILESLPVALYRPEPIVGLVIDREGQCYKLQTLVLSDAIHEVRRSEILEAALLSCRAMRQAKIGRAKLMLGEAAAMVSTVQDMVEQGKGFHQNQR